MINKSIKYSPKRKALGFLGKWSFPQVWGCAAASRAGLSPLPWNLPLYAGTVCCLAGAQAGSKTPSFKS